MALTTEERSRFTAAKLVQIDRMVDEERLFPVSTQGDDESQDDYDARLIVERDANVSNTANLSTGTLRARINIDGFRSEINYNVVDNDYTRDEQDALLWGHAPNSGPGIIARAESILAHDIEMVVDGIDTVTRKAILKARGG